MSNTVIEHKGIVVASNGHDAKVKIVASSACASCHAKGACSASDMEEKIIDVRDCGHYATGEEVMVFMQLSYGYIAIFYAYVLPFFLMFVSLISLMPFYGELIGGLVAIAVLVPYYYVVYLLRNRLKNKFRYTLKRLGL